jgi:hypothetical protein
VAQKLAGVPPEEVRALLESWHARRWIYSSPADVHLAVLPELRQTPRTLEEILPPAPRALRVIGR